jgi:hypothetical protein
MIEKEDWMPILVCMIFASIRNGEEKMFDFKDTAIDCSHKEKTYEEDCYFFIWEQDMGAHIPCCNKKNIPDCYEPKNCDKTKCKKYISRSRVDEIVNEVVGE